MKKTFLVKEDYINTRLDRWFRRNISEVPQSLIEKNIRKGNIKVNNKKEKSSYKLKNIDEIIICNINFTANKHKKKNEKYTATKKDLSLSSSIFIENNELSGESKFTGPVGIAQLTNQSSKQGLQSIAELVALISFSLGIFNLIPFPPLDGGKLFLELITISRNGYPLPSTFTYRLQLIGVSILFGLIIFVTLSDIINIFNG